MTDEARREEKEEKAEKVWIDFLSSTMLSSTAVHSVVGHLRLHPIFLRTVSNCKMRINTFNLITRGGKNEIESKKRKCRKNSCPDILIGKVVNFAVVASFRLSLAQIIHGYILLNGEHEQAIFALCETAADGTGEMKANLWATKIVAIRRNDDGQRRWGKKSQDLWLVHLLPGPTSLRSYFFIFNFAHLQVLSAEWTNSSRIRSENEPGEEKFALVQKEKKHSTQKTGARDEGMRKSEKYCRPETIHREFWAVL